MKVERRKQRARGRNSRVKQDKAGKEVQRSTAFKMIRGKLNVGGKPRLGEID